MKYQNYLKSLTCSNVNEVSCGGCAPLLLLLLLPPLLLLTLPLPLPKHAKKQMAETTMGNEDWMAREGGRRGSEEERRRRMKAKANT